MGLGDGVGEGGGARDVPLERRPRDVRHVTRGLGTAGIVCAPGPIVTGASHVRGSRRARVLPCAPMIARVSPPLALLAAFVCLAGSGCATSLFSRTDSREAAIRACSKEVPPDAVPYADAFSACMERHGWVYTGLAGPRG